MDTLIPISTRKTKESAISKVDFDHLEFGKYISDHMLVCDFSRDKGWQAPMILPYANLSLSPATLALHYGQTVFEGMKAFRMTDGRINIFRIERHYERFARSLERMCMAVPPKETFIDGLTQLVELDKDWVPSRNGAALYLRPFVYASESRFGLKISDQFRFVIFTGPVNELYAKPIKIKLETRYSRAARGGTGFAKCGGNYGASFLPTKEAREEGYDQVLWTDSIGHNYIEESGMMNIMFVINGRIVTPALTDSILDGVTRDSLLTLAADLGYPCEERPLSVAELEHAFRENAITEAFGAGTAAVVAPISTINIGAIDYQLPAYDQNNLMFRIKAELENIRTGKVDDRFNWNYVIGGNGQ
jgi:branched-chain amino acid aminotransferase